MVVADELDERWSVRLPIRGEPFEVFKNGGNARRAKNGNCVFGVLVEVGVENAHILKVCLPLDREEIPAEVMQPEHGDNVRLSCHRLLKILSILVEGRLPAGNDFRDDGEAVARRSPGEDRAIAALLDLVLEVSALRDRHGGGFRPVFLLRCV